MRSAPSMRDVARALTDLVFPDSCPGCGERSLPPACDTCLALLTGVPRPRPPDPSPPGLPPPFAVVPYAGRARALIVAHKEHGRLALAAPLGAALARAAFAASASSHGLVLVPVPSLPASIRRRGHDPTGRMAKHAARWLRRHGVDAHVLDVLRHQRVIDDQSGLGHAARALNLAEALFARPPSGRRMRQLPRRGLLVVVDDVVTTGATLAEAVRALHAADIPVSGVAVVAATQRLVHLPTGAAAV